MGMSVGENKGGAMAEMNVVPLIDILLVLLIIFMVITPLTPKGMDTLVPQPNPNQQQNQDLENKTVVVQIDKNGKVKNHARRWNRQSRLDHRQARSWAINFRGISRSDFFRRVVRVLLAG